LNPKWLFGQHITKYKRATPPAIAIAKKTD